MALVLKVNFRQEIHIGEDIVISVQSNTSNWLRVAITAPRELQVYPGDIVPEKQALSPVCVPIPGSRSIPADKE